VSKAEINTIPISTTGYTKISNSGAVLPDTATLGSGANDWACTKDNKTGLTWEVKTDDGGLRDKDWYYSWYKPSGDNGGFAGYTDTINGALNCSTQNNCNTDAFTNAVNAKGLCGKKDWRMPTKDELEGLLTTTSTINQPINDNLFIDANYFPNTNSRYWSSSPYADFSGSAWVVLFSNGLSRSNFKIYGYFVRLVRSESININEGAVTFILSINENGEVIDANIKNTEPDNVFDEDFLAEIKEIVMEMKFTPKIVNDKAVRFKGTKTFKFINGDKLKK
jgi:hypothetical protein